MLLGRHDGAVSAIEAPSPVNYLAVTLKAGESTSFVLEEAVPADTVVSLTSLGTGLPPGTHGVVGYSSRIPGTDELLCALVWDPKVVDPVEWQPHPTAFARLTDDYQRS